MKAKLNIRKINGIDALKMLLFDAWWRPLQQLHCFKKKKKTNPNQRNWAAQVQKGQGCTPRASLFVPQPLCCVWGVNSAHTLHLFCPHPSGMLLMMNPD